MPRVLVVDDDAKVLKATIRLLSRLGWQCEDSMCQTEPFGVDVVLSDWEPAGPCQLDMCREYGKPCVVYSGLIDDVPAGIRAIEKPATAQQIDAALHMAIIDAGVTR